MFKEIFCSNGFWNEDYTELSDLNIASGSVLITGQLFVTFYFFFGKQFLCSLLPFFCYFIDVYTKQSQGQTSSMSRSSVDLHGD